MKNWEQDLYIYQIHPVPPKKDNLQEYIDLYISEQDDKYLMWFLHYYEPVLNDTVKEAIERLDYRERLVVSEYLAFCPDCFKLKPKKVKLSDMAVKLCLTPDAIENVYKKAINKMRKYLEEKLL